jgi:hypothetical protein
LAAFLSICSPRHVSAFTAQDFGFEQMNMATATVSVGVNSLSHGEVEYSYTVTNVATSARPINLFYIQMDVHVSSLSTSNPNNWGVLGCCARDTVRKNATGIAAAGWLYATPAALIAPGNRLAGFKIRGKSIPAIKRFYVQSESSDETPDGEPGSPEEEAAVTELTDFFNDSTSGLTLGPDPLPVVIDLPALINRLIGLKHEVSSLGWLGNAKFVAKLDKRLDQAKAALTRDKKKLARVRLTQFVHELTKAHDDHRDNHEDDRGKDKDGSRDKKFVNNEAFQLLKLNAEFILSKLPAKAKDKDEEDECRRAQGEKDDDHDDGGKKGKGRDGGKEHDR